MKTIRTKIVSIALVIVMILGIMPLSVLAADGDMVIAIDQKTALAGSTVTININFTNNPGISSTKLKVAYDDSVLTLDSVSYNPDLGGQSIQPQKLSTPVTLTWVSPFANYSADGTFATLTFTVAEDAESDAVASISATYDPNDIYNMDEVNVECSVENGYVKIVQGVPGDINGDLACNNKDITRMFQYLAGWEVYVNTPMLDTNGDGSVNNKDLTRLFQYLADWEVEIHPNPDIIPTPDECSHCLESIPANTPLCKEDGNIAYWYCSLCEKYFSDASATTEIALEDTVLPATGHDVVIDPGVAATHTSTGLTEGSHCKTCGEILVEQGIIPILTYDYSIEYDIVGSDTYLATQVIDNSQNPTGYNSDEGTTNLVDLVAPDGYTFLGWYDAPQKSADAVKVKKIDAGTKGNEKLYAHWSETVYDITYKLYQTPLGAIEDEKYLSYTVSKGLTDLPNPELYNYVFLGWYTDDGTEITNIPIGTTGDITLNAYWTSKRNLTKATKTLEDPIIVENSDNGVIYFAYEIGTIENVPVSDAIWTIQSVAGLAQQKSETVSTTISQEKATTIAETISNTTVDSASWTLSNDWTDITSVSEQWAEQNGMSVEEANTVTKSTSGTYSFTSSNGGTDTTTITDGTTTLDYNSQDYTHGNSAEFNAKINAKYTAEAGATVGPLSASKKFEVGGEIGGGYEQHKETNEHTGTDTTSVDTTVTAGTTTWNSSSSASKTKTESESSTVKSALSQIISNTKGYGKTYSTGGENSEAQGFSSTDSTSVNTSSTLTYFTSETKTTTTTYSTDGKSDGCYRLVIAGTVHVFAVVGYDVATKSYFVYTYNVLDDKTHEFLDYSPNLNFNDYENGVLPFEVPYYVHEYVCEKTVKTDGLTFTTDTATGTATVAAYTGTDTDVTIPSYISTSGKSYKVTGLKASAFAGKDVRAVILSDYITELPTGAFEDCTKLEEISGYFTEIGENAFSGCTSLDNFNVSSATTYIGANAFAGVDKINVTAIDAQTALENAKLQNPDLDEEADAQQLLAAAHTITQEVIASALNSGAQEITLDISSITEGTVLTLDVPDITRFELQGGLKTYNDLKLTSDAETTALKELTITDCTRIPLEISSEGLQLDAVSVESPSFVLLLSATNPIISLTRDNKLISSGENAIVWRNPNLSSQIVDNTMGTLAISGNVYVCGDINGMDNMTVSNGKIIYVTESEFENYIKGVFKVAFDANGGSVNTTEKTVFYGSAIGELPTPIWTYHTFEGWYTAVDGGTKITEETITTYTEDITLYAHWTENSLSDWILVEDLPDDVKNAPEGMYEFEYANGYSTSTLERKTSGYASEEGWTMESKTQIGSASYGGWQISAPATSSTQSETYHTVVSDDTLKVNACHAWVSSDNKSYWKDNSSGTYSKHIYIYSSVPLASSGYSYDTANDGSYVVSHQTIGINSPGKFGTIYLMRDVKNNTNLTSHSSYWNDGSTWWPAGESTLHRTKTEKFQYTHTRWTDWSEMTMEEIEPTDSLKVDIAENAYVRYRAL